MVHRNASTAGNSSFQSLSVSLSGCAETGNNAGVATIILLGDYGLVCWIWAMTLIDSGSAFIESALGKINKRKENNEYRVD